MTTRLDLVQQRRFNDVTAVEVPGNIHAMVFAVEHINAGDLITVKLVLDIRQRLLAKTRLERHGEKLRDQQNWMLGSKYKPCATAFVPPPPEFVADIAADLAAFSNQDVPPAVGQAAVAHAQFETIRPFVEGNGRTGRTLVHLVFWRRGLAPMSFPWSRSSLRLGRRTMSRVSQPPDTGDRDLARKPAKE